ncbi:MULTISPECIES: DUF1566 domain-containing protein [Burkholderia]|uniref:DUF1566 domain-containing protein n=1 Tax=Burkholderia TaxID=32008 RepID=UPI00075C5553|nr:MULTISPECIES: DUF1566 domain-containing protein [Burkholderia]AOJ69366.1 hypothetical protein WS78_11835 [Burkholderia savannae]KVG37485.1 hypothetical protein WS77_02065 [Burkholderia sp. MSMB0265]KVG88251.1 hypothetical protein WS81_25160 [Burkholderia sp. MSMB2040]KVG93802.1 hypothetical protein WS82_08655 [Burkholderia sp. MSMB2041]KVH01054.1 hypothetical protein WS83_20215 [Burkholderia sp. MSMB2042]
MTITLQAIENEHARISAMIETFKTQSQATEYRVDAAIIPLAAGERFAGAILNDDGTLSHYLILLPGQAEDVNWKGAIAWAAEHGGELPTRREQSLLFANLKHEFDERYYWSCEQHEENSGWAWSQGFHYGSQTCHYQLYEFRARAVRRFIPSVI